MRLDLKLKYQSNTKYYSVRDLLFDVINYA